MTDETVAAVLALLAERYPRTFSVYERKRVPLKLNIHLDIMKEMEGAITPIELSVALKCYVANAHYLKICSKVGAPRFDLTGAGYGSISEDEATYATNTLMWRKIDAIDALHSGRDREAALAQLGLTEREARALAHSKPVRRKASSESILTRPKS